MLLVSLRTAGVRGTITRFVTTISTASATYHFYELDVASLDQVWLEGNERRREWVDYPEAIRRLAWKSELAQGLRASSLASWVYVEPRSEPPKSYSFNFSVPPMPFRDVCHKARDSCRKAFLQWILYAPVYFSLSSNTFVSSHWSSFIPKNFNIINWMPSGGFFFFFFFQVVFLLHNLVVMSPLP